MSRFRRIGLAATAVAAVLALAVPSSASTIGINGSSGPWYTVSGISHGWTFFMMTSPSTGGQTGVTCFDGDNGMPFSPQNGWALEYGSGLAQGFTPTLFSPAFQQPHPAAGGGCWFVDHNGDTSPVSLPMRGAFAFTLTGLAPGQNPSSPRRKYNGRLFFYELFGMSFVPAKYPGCTVKIVGPQSVDLPTANYYSKIEVDDDNDRIDLNVTDASFAITKTAACPSTIGNTVRIDQSLNAGWRLNNVTVTP